MRTTVAVAFVLVLALSAAGGDARRLYVVTCDAADELEALVEHGATVRHIGAGWSVIEAQTDLTPALSAAALSSVELGGSELEGQLYLCYPRSRHTKLSDYGMVLWREPGGVVLVRSAAQDLDRLRAECFAVVPLPRSVDVARWFDEVPPPPVREWTPEREGMVRGLVEEVIEAVSPDSLLSHVTRLSQYPDGTLRSRYVRREECLMEAKPYISGRLEAYLPEDARVDTQRFFISSYTCEEGPEGPVVELPADNVIAELPGTGQLPGCYIVCAHYDAIASHSFPSDPMWYCDNPAPGADDNATGVAVVLEAVRVLADLPFPFDLRFVLFSGEELGLLGSEAYADSLAGYRSYADSVVAAPDTIYGVINVDMVAFKRAESNPDTCHLVANRGSRWLADWMVATAEDVYASHFDGFEAMTIEQALAYSDHASFWKHGYDALVAIEHWDPRDRNPYYHTIDDTVGNVSVSQLAGVAKLVVGSVARLADPDVAINLAVFPGDIRFTPDEPVVGGSTTVSFEVHVLGPEEDVDMTVEAWDGEPDEGDLLASFGEARVMGGGETMWYEFVWDLEESDLGEHEVSVRVSTDGTQELTEADNVAETTLRVIAPKLFVMDHYAFPNPVKSLDDLFFRYELSREAKAIVITTYDLLGQEIASFSTIWNPAAGDDETAGTVSGWNRIAWSRFDGRAAGLASGVYLYRLEVYGWESSDPADAVIGKFAVVR